MSALRRRPRHRPRGSCDRHGRCIRVALVDAARQARVAFAHALRRTMRECNVSASELAAACDVSERLVFAYAAAMYLPSLARVRQFAAAMGVPVEHLLG